MTRLKCLCLLLVAVSTLLSCSSRSTDKWMSPGYPITGPMLVDEELLSARMLPRTSMLIQYSEARWRKMLGGFEKADRLPKTGMNEHYPVVFFTHFPSGSDPNGPGFPGVVGIPRCGLVKSKSQVCVAIWEWGPIDQLIFAGCRCFIIPDSPDREEEEPKEVTFQCRLEIDGKRIRCTGTCEKGKECKIRAYLPFEHFSQLIAMIWCSCVEQEPERRGE